MNNFSISKSISKFSQSPFDSIRKIDEHGNEFWTARELMPLLGYPRWNEFKESIERAKIACSNTGSDHTVHLSGSTLTNKDALGRDRSSQDFKLSRLGCYLTAMNGDPRKPEIAAAQTYFAIKTREAEVKPKTQLKILKEAIDQLLEQEERLTQAENAIAQIQQTQKEASEQLNALPPAKVQATPKTTRSRIGEAVRGFSMETSTPYPDNWSKLYQEFRDRYHIDLKRRAKNTNKRPLDIAEELEKLEELYAIALELFAREVAA